MIVVRNPMVRGTIFLKYEYYDDQLQAPPMERYCTRIFDRQINNIQEKLLFFCLLQNNILVLISFKSKNIYVVNNHGVYERQEDSICVITDILVDKEYTIIKGILHYFTDNANENNIRDTEIYYFDFMRLGTPDPNMVDELEYEEGFTDFRKQIIENLDHF